MGILIPKFSHLGSIGGCLGIRPCEERRWVFHAGEADGEALLPVVPADLFSRQGIPLQTIAWRTNFAMIK
jgi:hypothetical protein